MKTATRPEELSSRAHGKSSTSTAEARRSLDDIRTSLSDAMAGCDLLFFRQEAGLYDYLQDAVPYQVLQRPDLFRHIIGLASLHHTDIDDHVDLAGTISQRLSCLSQFGGRIAIAIWETYHGSDLKLLPILCLNT